MYIFRVYIDVHIEVVELKGLVEFTQHHIPLISYNIHIYALYLFTQLMVNWWLIKFGIQSVCQTHNAHLKIGETIPIWLAYIFSNGLVIWGKWSPQQTNPSGARHHCGCVLLAYAGTNRLAVGLVSNVAGPASAELSVLVGGGWGSWMDDKKWWEVW